MDKRLSKSYNEDQPFQTTETQQIGIHHLLPEILEEIFSYLRLRDLLNCRLVHPSWIKSATKPCRDKTKEIEFDCQDDAHRVLLMRHFMSLLKQSTDLQSFPTGNFKVKIGPSKEFQPSLEKLSADEITHFFNTIASFVTEFTVVVSLGAKTDHSYEFLPKDLKFLKLKCLTLCVRNVDKYSEDDDDDDDDPDNDDKENNMEKRSLLNFLSGVLENAKSLKQITLEIGDQWRTPTTAIRMCVEECGIRSKLNLLTYLKIKVNVEYVDWVTLGNMGLKLRSLSIFLQETTEGYCETFKGFLRSQADTLTALEITHRPWPISGDDSDEENYRLINVITKCTISFPSMTRLKSLEIISKEEDETVNWRIFQIPDLSYTGQFPALKILNLKQAKIIWPCFLRDDVLPLDTLEELILPQYCYDANLIINAALIFPNIKKLHVAAKEDILYAVYEHMQSLEDLTLYITLGMSIDDIISGVDPAEFPNVVGPRVAKVNAWKKLLGKSTGKSINCLQNLKILRLHSGGSLYPRRELEFSDISGLVLREMKSLQCLDLGVRELPSLPSELALLEDLRETLVVLLTPKERKLHRKTFYKKKFRGGGIYVPAGSDGFSSESSEYSDSSSSSSN